MVFKKYTYGGRRLELKNLLRERLKIKDSIRRHTRRKEYHNNQISILKTKNLPEIEEKIESLKERITKRI